MEFQHPLRDNVFAVDSLHQFVQRFRERSLLRTGLDHLPNAVADRSESGVQVGLQTVRHYRVQSWTQVTQADLSAFTLLCVVVQTIVSGLGVPIFQQQIDRFVYGRYHFWKENARYSSTFVYAREKTREIASNKIQLK